MIFILISMSHLSNKKIRRLHVLTGDVLRSTKFLSNHTVVCVSTTYAVIPDLRILGLYV